MKHISPRIRVVIIVAVLLTAGLAVRSNTTGQTIPETLVQTIMTPVKAAANALTKGAEQYYSYMFRYEALAAENEALREQIAGMEDEARRADSVSRENARLRQLLNLKSTNESYDIVDAYIIGWSSTDWTNTFTINRGTNAGIGEDMVAITETGEVVGLVTDVGLNWAEVTTILDSTLEISGTISASGYNGMVKGGYVDGHETLLKMNYLPSAAIIRNKEQVVTSGSTVYPRGLIMGSIVDAGFAETGIAKYALLDPAADIDSLEQIFIITQYTTEVTSQPAASETEQTAQTAQTETQAPVETFPEGNVG